MRHDHPSADRAQQHQQQHHPKKTGLPRGSARTVEERYRTLLAAIPDVMFRFRRDGTYLDYHATDPSRLWREPKEFLGRRIEDVFPGEFARIQMGWIEKTLAEGGTHTFEFRGFGENSDQHWEIRMTRCGPNEVVALTREVTEQKQAEEELRRSEVRQRVLLRELDHRVRNNLASLVALIDISSRGATDVQEFAEAIRRRVQAMALAHGLITRSHLAPLDLRGLMSAIIPPELTYCVDLDGPEVFVLTRQTTALGMVIHEIVTNSIKHGSLGALGGRVSVRWLVAAQPGPTKTNEVEILWRESGGPPMTKQPKPGVGMMLLQGLVESELQGRAELNFPQSGASHRLVLGLDASDEMLKCR